MAVEELKSTTVVLPYLEQLLPISASEQTVKANPVNHLKETSDAARAFFNAFEKFPKCTRSICEIRCIQGLWFAGYSTLTAAGQTLLNLVGRFVANTLKISSRTQKASDNVHNCVSKYASWKDTTQNAHNAVRGLLFALPAGALLIHLYEKACRNLMQNIFGIKQILTPEKSTDANKSKEPSSADSTNTSTKSSSEPEKETSKKEKKAKDPETLLGECFNGIENPSATSENESLEVDESLSEGGENASRQGEQEEEVAAPSSEDLQSHSSHEVGSLAGSDSSSNAGDVDLAAAERAAGQADSEDGDQPVRLSHSSSASDIAQRILNGEDPDQSRRRSLDGRDLDPVAINLSPRSSPPVVPRLAIPEEEEDRLNSGSPRSLPPHESPNFQSSNSSSSSVHGRASASTEELLSADEEDSDGEAKGTLNGTSSIASPISREHSQSPPPPAPRQSVSTPPNNSILPHNRISPTGEEVAAAFEHEKDSEAENGHSSAEGSPRGNGQNSHRNGAIPPGMPLPPQTSQEQNGDLSHDELPPFLVSFLENLNAAQASEEESNGSMGEKSSLNVSTSPMVRKAVNGSHESDSLKSVSDIVKENREILHKSLIFAGKHHLKRLQDEGKLQNQYALSALTRNEQLPNAAEPKNFFLWVGLHLFILTKLKAEAREQFIEEPDNYQSACKHLREAVRKNNACLITTEDFPYVFPKEQESNSSMIQKEIETLESTYKQHSKKIPLEKLRQATTLSEAREILTAELIELNLVPENRRGMHSRGISTNWNSPGNVRRKRGSPTSTSTSTSTHSAKS